MTFDQWINEIENYSSRYERAVDDMSCDPTDIDRWLKEAYKVGYKAGVEEKHNVEHDV